MKPTILTCAVTGTFPTRKHNPNLPVTPQEIAEACIGAAKAGAAVCHIHVRDPQTGAPSMKLEYYREVVERIRASDTDLVAPLATVALPPGLVSEASWDGTLPAGFEARAGDEFAYIVRAYGADGSYDETYPRSFQLVSPDEAKRGGETLRDATERGLGQSMDSAQAEAQSQIQAVFGNNALRVQNIPIHGSKIRIQGRNLPDNASVSINGRPQPLELLERLGREPVILCVPLDRGWTSGRLRSVDDFLDHALAGRGEIVAFNGDQRQAACNEGPSNDLR